MAVRNPKTGRFETSATTRARLAQEKAEAELAEIKRKQMEEKAREKELTEESIFDDSEQEFDFSGADMNEEFYASRGAQLCIIIASAIIIVGLFAFAWWVATLIRPYLFG